MAFLAVHTGICMGLKRISVRNVKKVVPVSRVRDIICSMETLIQQDEGKRGIKDILLPSGELMNAAHELISSEQGVAIITGFPCMLDYTPPTETDGPLGALAIARSLLAIGKYVILLTDECNEEVLLAACAAAGLAQYKELLTLESFPPGSSFSDRELMRLSEIRSSIDRCVAIERAGPNRDGQYLTMSGRDMTPLIAPLELLFNVDDEEEGMNRVILSMYIPYPLIKNRRKSSNDWNR